MALPTTSVNIPGVSRMELMAVLGREYRRELDPDVTGGLHPIAAQWNREMNQRKLMTAMDPFARDQTFTENYMREYPDEAMRIRVAIENAQTHRVAQERAMDTMDQTNLADAFRVPGYQQALNEPTDMERMLQDLEIGVDHARLNDRTVQAMDTREYDRRMMENLARDGQVTRRLTDGVAGPQQEALTYADLHAMNEAIQPATDSNWDRIEPAQPDFEEDIINFLIDKQDIAEWMDDLSDKFGTKLEDTLEIALRMAMEVVFKENEAQMAGLNKKLQDMEERRE